METPLTTSKLRVGIVGAGAISRNQHLPAWTAMHEAQVVGLSDIVPSVLATLGDQFSVPQRYLDYREMLDNPAIDVVDICAPSALHAEIAIQAFEAGKHVLCEKPMATSHAAAAAMLAAAERAGKKLMVVQHLRFTPEMRQLRAFLDRSPIGDIYYARAQWLRRRRVPARSSFTERRYSGGGALYDLGVHMVDLAWWLAGCPRPMSVTGATYDRLGHRGDLGGDWGEWNRTTIDVEDFAVGLIRFATGAALLLEVSWLGFQPEPETRRIQLFGTSGGLVWPDGVVTGETNRVPWNLQVAETTGEKPHHEVIRQFAHAVLNDAPVPIPTRQSANTVAMLDALYRAQLTGVEQLVEWFELAGD